MRSGYEQHFKKAQKIAAAAQPPRPVNRKVQSQDAKILAKELRERVRPRVQKKPKRSIPWKLAGGSFMGILLAAGGLLVAEDIEKFAKNIEISLLGSAHAASDTKPAEKSKDAADPKAKKEGAAAATGAGAVGEAAAATLKKEYSEEEISHFAKLNERKRELDAREEELGRMEQEIAAQKVELEKRLQELEGTRKNISTVLEEKVQADDKKVDNLVQMYSSMKPQQAAKAFEEMDEGLAIEILGRMKKKNAAEIMNLVKSEKVKILSEKYAGYKRNQ